VASDDLFLLALCDGDEDQPARRALAAAGVTADRFGAEIAADGDAEPGCDYLTFAPAFYTMEGLAEGFAASLGDGRITPEHVLLAILWLANGHSVQILWRLGITRESILDGLRDLGVVVPAGPLPRQVEIEWGERVWFDRDQLNDVISHLAQRIPPGTHWGFNYEAGRAWANAEAGFDLAALVAAATASD